MGLHKKERHPWRWVSLSFLGCVCGGQVSRFNGARSASAGSMMSTVMPRPSAMAWMVSRVTAYFPASMRETWVRWSPARSESCSWLSPANLRRVAMRRPMRSRVACFCSSVMVRGGLWGGLPLPVGLLFDFFCLIQGEDVAFALFLGVAAILAVVGVLGFVGVVAIIPLPVDEGEVAVQP